MDSNRWLCVEDDPDLLSYLVLVGGWAIMGVSAVHHTRRELRVDRAEPDGLGGVRMQINHTGTDLWTYTDRLAFRRDTWYFGMPNNDGGPTPRGMLWWTGAGWMDKTGAAVLDGPQATVQGG